MRPLAPSRETSPTLSQLGLSPPRSELSSAIRHATLLRVFLLEPLLLNNRADRRFFLRARVSQRQSMDSQARKFQFGAGSSPAFTVWTAVRRRHPPVPCGTRRVPYSIGDGRVKIRPESLTRFRIRPRRTLCCRSRPPCRCSVGSWRRRSSAPRELRSWSHPPAG